jgi:dihydrofolate reductase
MISIISAISKNNCIGINNKLPWNLPEDLKRFKDLTTGKVVIMGRKTWESLPQKFRPLPNRKNVIITRQIDYSVPFGVDVFANIEDALKTFENQDIFIIGGAEIYRQTIDLADSLYITHIHREIRGDAFFPEIDENKWKLVDEQNFNDFSFLEYER